MSSTFRPLTSSPQHPSNSTQATKAMHPQGAPTSYGQPGHLNQGMVNLHPNTNLAHTHPNTQQHHYLNVPNASGHYMNQNMGQIPASNHPVPNPASGSAGGGQLYNATPPKTVPYMSGYQPNMGHSVNQSSLPPVSQSLPPSAPPPVPVTNPPASSAQQSGNNLSMTTPAASGDRPQSNGTAETKPTSKLIEQQMNSVSPIKEKPPVVQTAPPVIAQQPVQPPSVTAEKPPEKPKPASALEPIASRAEVTKTPDTPPSNAPTPPMSNSESNSSSPTLIEKPITPAPAPAVLPSSPPEKDSKEEETAVAVDEKEEEKKEESLPVQAVISENSTGSSEQKPKESTNEEQGSEPSIEENSSPKPQEQSPTKREPSPAKSAPPPSTPRTPTRKSRTPKPEESSTVISKQTKEVKTPAPKSPSTKRQRIPTQPYQSPLPELEIITKITAASTPRGKNTDDKLIVFYKNEFLAVRNAEGGFYLCQAVQNVYKSSSKIKIRWLSQDKTDKDAEIYTPDFYDLTDFDCILTNLSLSRVDKGKYKLPNAEKERTESILNRSLAVEKGEVTSPSLTEEHPDGLDLSLYKAEDQLKKGKRSNRKRGRKPSKSPAKKETPTRKSPQASKVRKVAPPKPAPAPVAKKVVATAKKPPPAPPKKTAPPTRASEPVKKAPASTSSTRSGRGVLGKRKAGSGGNEKPKTSPVVDSNKAKVLAKIGRKAAVAATVSASKIVTAKKIVGKASKSTASPVASTSKKAAATKTQAAKLPPTRSGKRSTRK